jgi:hypothetical protein
VYVLYLGSSSGSGDELRDPGLAGVGIEDADENRSVQSGVGCEPLIDIAVTSESDLSLVAIRELWGQRNLSVVDWPRRLIAAVKKG